MTTLFPPSNTRVFVKPVSVADSDVARQVPLRKLLPEAIVGCSEYIANPTELVAFVRKQLDDNSGTALASLAAYASNIASATGKSDLQRGVGEDFDARPLPTQNAEAATRLAQLRSALAPLLKGGELPALAYLAASDVTAIYAAARATDIPLGDIRCRDRNGALVRLVERVQPQTVGFTGGTLVANATVNTSATVSRNVADYMAKTSSGPALELKLSKRLVSFVTDKLSSAGIYDAKADDVEAVLRAFVSGNRGSIVASLRQLAVTSPDILPRLQRVLRNYNEEALSPDLYRPDKASLLESVTRIVSLLFGGDIGLRKVQVAAMTADLVRKSDRVAAVIDARTAPAVWDVAIIGMGAHGRAAADRIAQTNPELRVLGSDRAPTSYNFGRGGGAYFMNSRQGRDDGRPGGNGRGNINPVAGAFLVSDASGTAYPVARDVDDVGVMALHEAAERSHLDLTLDAEVTKIEHRSSSADPNVASWEAAFRITYANGRETFAHKCIVANGFGMTPKVFGDAESNARFQTALKSGQQAIATWREQLAEAIVNGGTRAPSLLAPVLTVADAMAVADTDGCDALAPFRANTPPGQGNASCTFVGYGDSSRTAIELALGLAPDEAYRNTPAQLGQLKDLVWIVGDGPASCFEFLVGRDHLKKVLSEGAYAAFLKVMNDKPIEELFVNDDHMKEIREKLAPADQAALDGARTRYQRISGAILKGTLRLESSVAAGIEQTDRQSTTLKLADGRTLVTSRLIDGRGYEAELGPVAWLTDPRNPNPRKRISDASNLTRVRAPVPEGVIGRDSAGAADVAKSVAGLESDFAWAGPGNGGDVVSRKLIEQTTKVGANTVSLFANQPLTLAATDKLATGATRVGPSIVERNPETKPALGRSDAPTRVAKMVKYADLTPVEVRADSWLETHARLAAIMQNCDVGSFTAGDELSFAIRRAGDSAVLRGVTLELSSEMLDKATLDRFAKELTRDGRFTALVLQSLQDTDVALQIGGTVRDTTRGLQLDVPSSRLVHKDADQLAGEPVPPPNVSQREARQRLLAAQASVFESIDKSRFFAEPLTNPDGYVAPPRRDRTRFFEYRVADESGSMSNRDLLAAAVRAVGLNVPGTNLENLLGSPAGFAFSDGANSALPDSADEIDRTIAAAIRNIR